ncbi:hypothetical protein WN55_10937 [Dufourea novaeangliae]|nr:hypothetical protein WN55_10937 [Dufourea novaeangliae]
MESVTVSETNYMVSWDMLQKRCNKPRQLVQAYLKSLLELAKIEKDTPANLRMLAEKAQMNVQALRVLKQPTEYWDAFLIFLVTRKLDKDTRRAWDRTLENEEIPKFEDLINFILKQARGDDVEDEQDNSRPFNHMKSQKRGQSYVSRNNMSLCFLCNETHEILVCSVFIRMTPRERSDAARKAKLCLNCLQPSHNVQNCRSRTCRKCGRKHHTMLHFAASKPESFANTQANPSDNKPISEPVRNTLTVAYDSEVLLGTAQVKFVDRYNNEHLCRVLLDGGSQTHFITHRLAEKLQLPKRKIDLTFAGLNQLNTRAEYSVSAIIKSRSGVFKSEVTFIVLPSITGVLPSRQVDRSKLAIPTNVSLADPEFHKPADVDALLGTSLFYRLLSVGQIKLCQDSVILQKTQLGWIVTGETNVTQNARNQSVRSCHVTTNVDKQLTRFWEIEELPNKKFLSAEETACEMNFAATTIRDSDGRYVVRLPFNEKKGLLGESRNAALKRFFSLERKLQQNPELFREYSVFLKEYEDLGHMSETRDDRPTEGFYLPHHAVIKESSATTKTRVVFDASAKSPTFEIRGRVRQIS